MPNLQAYTTLKLSFHIFLHVDKLAQILKIEFYGRFIFNIINPFIAQDSSNYRTN